MRPCNLRSLLLAAIVLSNCITWTASKHHFTHNVSGHRSRHRRQGTGLYLPSSYVIPGGEGTGWGEWGVVSPCSRSCGGGVASQKRICLHVGSDGSQCTGGDTKYFSCETQDCPEGSPDFRAEQCSEFNNKTFRSITYKWEPYTNAPNPCELNCMPHGERFYYRHKTAVVDGTRCNDESFDVCVQGICQRVGCDMMLGSNAKEDKCRECRGNGVNCYTTNGLIDTQDLIKGYNDIMLIPQGATNIIISEVRASSNYLALRPKNGSTYYLNGDYHIDFPRSLVIAGTIWRYERNQQGFPAPDKLRCLGPTTEPLYLSLLLQDVNVGIEYEYSLPKALGPRPKEIYNWVHSDFTPCSASCGGGFQFRNVTCSSREELEEVDEGLCDEALRPVANQTCNLEECPAQWIEGPWSACSKPCGDGGTKSRKVYCQKIITNGEAFSFPSVVADKECFDLLGKKPELYQECNQNATCPTWFTGSWTPCDKLCDEGKQKRKVVCTQVTDGKVEVFDDTHCLDEKPPTEQSCIKQLCKGVDWVLSDWTGCDTCLSKTRTRQVECVTEDRTVVNSSFCSYHPTPILEEPCTTEVPDCVTQWYATQWSPCSVKCGNGTRTRRVFCGTFDGKAVTLVDDSECNHLVRYNDTKPCEIPNDKCPAQWYAGPWPPCDKKCGAGEQIRDVMCLQNGTIASSDLCPVDDILDSTQSCNKQPCDADNFLPAVTTIAPDTDDDDDDDDYCDEEYPEMGIDIELEKTPEKTINETFITTEEGSGMGSTFADLETTFMAVTNKSSDTDLTLSTDDLIPVKVTGDMFTSDYDNITDSDSTTDITEFATTESTELSNSTLSNSTTNIDTDTTEAGSATTESTELSNTTLSKRTTNIDIDSTDAGTASTEPTELSNSTLSNDTDTTEAGTASTEPTELSNSTLSNSTTNIDADTTEAGSAATEPTELANGTLSNRTTNIDTDSTVAGTASTEATELSNSTLSNDTDTTAAGTLSNRTTNIDEDTTVAGSASTESTELSNSTTNSDTDTTEAGSASTESTELSNSTTNIDTDSTVAGSATTDLSNSTDTTEAGSATTESSNSTTNIDTDSTTADSATTETTELSSSTISDSTTNTETDTTVTDSSTTDSSTESSSTLSDSTTNNNTDTTVAETTETTDLLNSTLSNSTTDIDTTDTTAAGSTSTEPTELSNSTLSNSTTNVDTDTTEAATTETTELSNSTLSNRTTNIDEDTTIAGTASTEPTELSNSTLSNDTDTTEAGSTTESADLSNTTLSNRTTNIDEDTTVAGSTSTEPTDLSNSTLANSTTNADTDTTEAGSTSTEPTELSNSTLSSTTNIDTDTTEAGSTTTELTELTNSTLSNRTTNVDTDTTEAEIETTTTGSITTDGATATEGSTSSESNTTDGLSTTEEYITEISTTEGSAISEGFSTTEGATTAEGSTTVSGITPWKISSSVGPTGTSVCKPRKFPKCSKSKYGCCPDKKTAASGPFDAGCLKPKTCNETSNGCCPDGVSPALGPNDEGCPIAPCSESLYGCCTSDNKTAAEGNEQEGCPPPPPACVASEFGCCQDGETPATGAAKAGCPESSTSTVSSTTIEEDCAESTFGCCYDNKTEATGPNAEGCPCNITEFGCCPDGVSPADGVDYEGCVGACGSSKHGCCEDGLTPAHGPAFEGCCLSSPFGCCPDNYNQAKGPHLEGCGCQYAHFGCCPDNVTIARGHYNEGCGCQYSEHGCCPDRHTEATGSKYEGCDCHTFQFGCCPDGVTVAVGPNQQGCHCRDTKYGCCGDGETAALGPDQIGCDCSSSMHGCCPDGITDAKGPKFEGCTEVIENKQAACGLATDRGSCHNYSVYWYYDVVYGGCSRFWYGGCEGNGNRFESKEDCQDVCVRPPDKDVCKLPKVKGACVGYNIRWYYDSENEQCSQFYYGGCLGNSNNFDSRELCQQKCEPERSVNQCNLPIERGPCNGTFNRWGFNSESHECEQFLWGGCEGNSNRFGSETACNMRCNPPGTPKPICTLPQETGNCTEKQALWSFSQTENRCVPFYYTGCKGNENKFDSFESCTDACPSDYEPNECTLPAATGECANYREKWYYDTNAKICRTFYYGGCGGNPNNFESQQECEKRCTEPEIITTAKPPEVHKSDLCQLPMSSGPCDESLMRWFYDVTTDSCSQFTFGGCEGNANRFETRNDCESRCKTGAGSTTPHTNTAASSTTDSSTIPSITSIISRSTTAANLVSGSCEVSADLEQCTGEGEVWYLDEVINECVVHINSDEGVTCRTTGVFDSLEACVNKCGGVVVNDECKQAPILGACRSHYVMWYHDEGTHDCQQFIYSGCGGNNNRFETRNDCMTYCRSNVVVPITSEATPTTSTTSSSTVTSAPSSSTESTAITTVASSSTTAANALPEGCEVTAALEQCTRAGEVWYLDTALNECVAHANSDTGVTCRTTGVFDSQEACERSCGAFRDIDVCRSTVDPGQCRNFVSKFYFDVTLGHCKEFSYGGCQGGPNRFSSIEECMQVCDPYIDLCKQNPEAGNCLVRYIMWYYDEARDQCAQFIYTGCGGNKNRFETREDCEGRCRQPSIVQTTTTISPITVTTERVDEQCRTPISLEPCGSNSTVFYYDSDNKKCVESNIGGCRHANSYRSEEECERQCGAFRSIINVCGARLDPGPCRMSIPKYYWDSASGSCQTFAYSGCHGGANRFSSIDECENVCADSGPDTNEVVPSDCEWYNEECSRLECTHGVTRTPTEDGCERCSCKAAVDPCEPARQKCDALKDCSYGIDRFTEDNGCQGCRCLEHPCASLNCPAGERCVPGAYRDPLTQEVKYTATCEIDENEVVPPRCQWYIDECSRLECTHGVTRTPTEDGCDRCTCKDAADPCEPARQKCDALKDCSYGIDRFTEDNGCQGCRCSEHPCASFNCPAGQHCVPGAYRHPLTEEVKHVATCEIDEDRTEPNEVLPDCEPYKAECARLQCEYGVQRTRAGAAGAAGCERCACVTLEANCSLHARDCDQLICSYGKVNYKDADGCQRCD